MQTLGKFVAADGARQKTKTTRESEHGQRGFIDCHRRKPMPFHALRIDRGLFCHGNSS
jgi:hypothetical protein